MPLENPLHERYMNKRKSRTYLKTFDITTILNICTTKKVDIESFGQKTNKTEGWIGRIISQHLYDDKIFQV